MVTSWKTLVLVVLIGGVSFGLYAVNKFSYFSIASVSEEKLPCTTCEDSLQLALSDKRAFVEDEVELPQSFLGIDGAVYARIPDSDVLDPVTKHPFIISFLVRFSALPDERKRQNIIEKYETNEFPYPGWAIAIQRINSILRPQVYWRDKKGKGGWYTFGEVHITSDQWYTFSLIVNGQGAMLMFIESMEDEAVDSFGDDNHKHKLRFLGGYDIESVSVPSTDAVLSIGVARSNGKAFKGDIKNIVIGAPSLDEMRDITPAGFVDGGPENLKKRMLKESVALAISPKWDDLSDFAHSVERIP